MSAGGFDKLACARTLVAAQVVHDDDVAWLEFRNQDLLHIGFECIPVDRPVQHERRDHPAQAQTGDESRGLPVPMRHGRPQTLAFGRPTVAAGHVGLGPGFVDEDKPLRVKVELVIEPDLPLAAYVRAVLLAGMGRLFLRVILWRLKKRCSVP